MSGTHPTARSARTWSLERALFAIAGTVTLATVVLAVLVSPWFLLVTAMVGVSQWMFVVVGDCPTSLVLRRFTHLRGCVR
jgi:Flp pilus assembly protein TadB